MVASVERTMKTLHALAFVMIAGCKSAGTPTPAPGASAAPLAFIAAPDAATPSLLDALPKPVIHGSAPVKTVGYPRSVMLGMNDPADVAGFTSDGSEYGYCATLGARDPPSTHCVTVLRDGTTKLRSSDDAKGNYSKTLASAVDAWVKSSGIPVISPKTHVANAVTGSWNYSDITIWVNPVSGDGATTRAVLQVGGAVDREAPVYPIALSVKPGTPQLMHHTVWANDLSLSPDGVELGIVGGFLCMEWCDDFVIHRDRVGAFASLVYNDTGFRHHKKGDYARAAELFLAATWADETAKLPPYNLACAWARLGDARAKDALAVAIQRDPSARRRAVTDDDFARVKSEAWFTALTRS